MAWASSSSKGVRKPFSQDLFSQYDGPAIQTVRNYLESQGVHTNLGEKFGVDLVVFRSGGYKPSSFVEVEVVSQWKDGSKPFPYPLCNIPERKGKYVSGELGLPCTIYRLSADLRSAILVPDYLIAASPLVEVPNRLVAEGEFFFRCDVSELETVSLITEVEDD